MSTHIYLSPPDIGPAEEEAALRAIRSGWVAPLGPEVDAFEQEVAARVGVECAVALSSGTAALHLGLITLDVQPGDYVLTSTLTFVATANAISYTGAIPYFVDVEPASGNMNPNLLEDAIQQLRADGKQIGAIIPVDLLGKVAANDEIVMLATRHDIPVLCDAAESFGATRNGRAAGSWGEASVISFNGNKIMTTSGGGMLVTPRQDIADRARFLATQARDEAAHYQHSVTGYNYRLSNVLAAIGRAQLARLDSMIHRRRTIREHYRTLFQKTEGVEIFGGKHDGEDNCWLTAILIDSDTTGWSAADLSAQLAKHDIESRPLWKPMHLQPLFASSPGTLDGTAERLFTHGLALPSGSSLSDEGLERITATIQTQLS